MSGTRFDPLAAVIQGSESADSAKNRGGAGRFEAIDFFRDLLGSSVKSFAAADVEAGGAGMTIDGGLAVQTVARFDPAGPVPMEEVMLDRFAFGMVANVALATVASGACIGGAGCTGAIAF